MEISQLCKSVSLGNLNHFGTTVTACRRPGGGLSRRWRKLFLDVSDPDSGKDRELVSVGAQQSQWEVS